jgi:hypothetical protein
MSRNLVLNACGVVAAVCLGIYLSREPWIAYREQKGKADIATKEMLKVESEKAELERQRAKLETPMGKEELARRNSYVKQGEEAMPAPVEH